jgi:hypothetical protein
MSKIEYSKDGKWKIRLAQYKEGKLAGKYIVSLSRFAGFFWDAKKWKLLDDKREAKVLYAEYKKEMEAEA